MKVGADRIEDLYDRFHGLQGADPMVAAILTLATAVDSIDVPEVDTSSIASSISESLQPFSELSSALFAGTLEEAGIPIVVKKGE